MVTQTYKELQETLGKLGVDLGAQLTYLVDLRQRVREGIMTEKVCAGQGNIQVLETSPSIELQTTRLMFDIVKYVDQMAQDNAGGTVVLNIQVTEATEIE